MLRGRCSESHRLLNRACRGNKLVITLRQKLQIGLTQINPLVYFSAYIDFMRCMNRQVHPFQPGGMSRVRYWLALFAIVLAIAGRMGDVLASDMSMLPHEPSDIASQDSASPPCKSGSDHKDHHACQTAHAGTFIAVEVSAESFLPPRRVAAAMLPASEALYRSRSNGPDFRPPKSFQLP